MVFFRLEDHRPLANDSSTHIRWSDGPQDIRDERASQTGGLTAMDVDRWTERWGELMKRVL